MYSRAWMALEALKALNAPCTPVSRPEQRNPMSSVALSLGGRQGTNSAGLGASDANGQINYNVARLKKAARRVDQLTRLSPFFDPKNFPKKSFKQYTCISPAIRNPASPCISDAITGTAGRAVPCRVLNFKKGPCSFPP
jgi:hypothetical protein